MGEKIGAEVWLDRAPVKYDGLSYTEIWISEAQERMVLSCAAETSGTSSRRSAVGRCRGDRHRQVCADRTAEAEISAINVVGDLSMQFLHEGRPPVVREAVYRTTDQAALLNGRQPRRRDHTGTLMQILGSLNVASKHWIIRQYDHEVHAGSVIKPLVGVSNDGPSDAAVVRPVLESATAALSSRAA